MAATRRHHPHMHVYQDPTLAFDHHEVAEAEAALLSALGPVTDVSTSHHTLLNPTIAGASGQSPLKPRGQSSSPPSHALSERNIDFNSIPPPRQPGFSTDSLQKRPTSAHTSSQKQQSPVFAQYQPAAMDKENSFAAIYGDQVSQFTDALYGSKAGKRAMPAATLQRDSRHAKGSKVKSMPDDEHLPIPAPEHMPPVHDEYGTSQKPPYHYSTLIAMAILRAPDRRLTLAQIYKWIADTFGFYDIGETGWRNSIRHNLSLNKSFEKQVRAKEDPGKGSYWAIKAGHERQFYQKERPRRHNHQDGAAILHSTYSDLPRPSSAPEMMGFAVYPAVQPAPVGESIDSSRFPDETELSSDATIPASDPAIHEGHDASAEENDMPPPSHHLRSSPPPNADIRSSPPPTSQGSRHEGTPPRVTTRFPSNSRSGGRKRKFSALGDSGYYSSIESSAIKGQLPALTSEADVERPAKKRGGRAEDEIARMRGSSFDSPTKNRPVFAQPGSQVQSSSPFRPFEKTGNELQTPLTPAIVFKKPAMPPASVSPNTNLRNHRNRVKQMIGSPDKSLGLLVDGQWSPAFKLPDEENFNLHEDNFSANFDIFNDSPVRQHMGRGSPEKRSAKRPSIGRAATSSNILADITGSRANTLQSPAASTPWLKPASSRVRNFFAQPAAPSPIKASGADELFGVELHSDDSEPGFDILQGFQQIGHAAIRRNDESPTKRPAVRPGMGRSTTSIF